MSFPRRLGARHDDKTFLVETSTRRIRSRHALPSFPSYAGSRHSCGSGVRHDIHDDGHAVRAYPYSDSYTPRRQLARTL